MLTLQIRGRALVSGVALVTITLMLGCSTASEPSATSPVHDESAAAPWILFQQDGAERTEIAMVRQDGSDRHSPVAALEGGGQTNPDWSPDGDRFVFAMNDGERDDLWVADADGSGARMLLDCNGTCRWLDDPDWSPDGTQIVYSRSIQLANGWGIGTLETVEVDTGQVEVLLGPWKRFFTAGARYSPDGGRVVFERVHKIGRSHDADVRAVSLVVVRLDRPGYPIRPLTDSRLFAATADWSPDGERIAYSALVEPGSDAQELFWIRPEGGESTQVTHLAADGGYGVEPAWLPDGSGVLFSGRLEGPGSPQLLRVGIDGSGAGSAVGDDLLGRHPRVQPVP